ncbi:MAG: hypothetical protein J0L55_11855 [Caulobacterales bacterium]|nr:hypothetical protein [Caulobacterales bacterium]MCA0372382.1 hypothetical protein [Pseudomonadota bacterium]
MENKKVNFQKQAMMWEALSTIIACLLIIYLIRDRFVAATDYLPNMNLTQQVSIFFLSMLDPIFWVSIIAPISYANVSIAAVSLFRAIGKGDDFSPAILKGLEKMGANLLIGSTGAIMTPTLINWVWDKGFKIEGTTENFVILIVGGALYFIADIGKKMRNELESFV